MIDVAARYGDAALYDALAAAAERGDAGGALSISQRATQLRRSGADRSRLLESRSSRLPEPGHGELPGALFQQSCRPRPRLGVSERELDRARAEDQDRVRRRPAGARAQRTSATRARATTSAGSSTRTACRPPPAPSARRSSRSTTASTSVRNRHRRRPSGSVESRKSQSSKFKVSAKFAHPPQVILCIIKFSVLDCADGGSHATLDVVAGHGDVH